jgi:hypothetical protein
MGCNIGQDAIFFNSFGNALFFKGRQVKISANIAFLFYKEIYLTYVTLYYNMKYYHKLCTCSSYNYQVFLQYNIITTYTCHIQYI